MSTTETHHVPAVIPAEYVSKPLPDNIKALLTPIQQGWLLMCDRRELLFNSLLRGELEIQNLVNAINETTTLEVMQETLKKAKALAAEKKDQRLQFTNLLDEKVVKPSMEFEKRNELVIAALVKTELTKREEAEKTKLDGQKLETEKANYKAHVENENLRIKTEYCNTLSRRIAFYFTTALQAEKKMSAKELAAHIVDIKNELTHIELGKPGKFERKLVDVDTAKAILGTITMYNPAADLDEYKGKVDTTFAMYDQDFKNKDAAITSINNAVEEDINQNNEAFVVESSTNNLQASAADQSFVMSGGPVVKRKLTVVVDGISSEWAMAVLTNFIRLFPRVAAELKVKSWDKLTLAQMAKSFDKLLADDPKLELKGLKTEEIKK